MRIWNVRTNDKREFNSPIFDNMMYKGMIFMTTGIMKSPNIKLIITFLPLKSNLANAYPPNALTVTLNAVLPRLTKRLLIRLITSAGSESTKL